MTQTVPQKHKMRKLRVDEFNWTQQKLAAVSGVSATTISNIECHRGPDVAPEERRKTKTRLRTAVLLAIALQRLRPGVYSLDELLEYQDLFSEGEMLIPKKRRR